MRRDRRAYDDMHKLLKNIKYTDPNISEADAREQLWSQLQTDSEQFFRLLFDNWFETNWPRYRAIVSYGAVALMKDENRKTRKAKRRERKLIKRAVETVTQLVLMNLKMPNGKLLRDCTGADCSRFGGWCLDIAKRIGATEKVGKHLTETDLQNLYGRNTRRVA